MIPDQHIIPRQVTLDRTTGKTEKQGRRIAMSVRAANPHTHTHEKERERERERYKHTHTYVLTQVHIHILYTHMYIYTLQR